MPKNKTGHIQSSESKSYTGTQELRDSEVGLVGYSTEIVRKFFSKMNLENRIILEKGSILEFGAGTGFLADILKSRFHIEPVGSQDLVNSSTLRELPGVNINTPGSEGMQLNLYVPTKKRLIMSEGTYFAPLPPKYKFTVVNISSQMWISGNQIEKLNANYGLIEEASYG